MKIERSNFSLVSDINVEEFNVFNAELVLFSVCLVLSDSSVSSMRF